MKSVFYQDSNTCCAYRHSRDTRGLFTDFVRVYPTIVPSALRIAPKGQYVVNREQSAQLEEIHTLSNRGNSRMPRRGSIRITADIVRGRENVYHLSVPKGTEEKEAPRSIQNIYQIKNRERAIKSNMNKNYLCKCEAY